MYSSALRDGNETRYPVLSLHIYQCENTNIYIRDLLNDERLDGILMVTRWQSHNGFCV